MSRARHLAAFLDMAGAAFRGPPVSRYPDPAIFDPDAFRRDVAAIDETQAGARAILDRLDAALNQQDQAA